PSRGLRGFGPRPDRSDRWAAVRSGPRLARCAPRRRCGAQRFPRETTANLRPRAFALFPFGRGGSLRFHRPELGSTSPAQAVRRERGWSTTSALISEAPVARAKKVVRPKDRVRPEPTAAAPRA